jgi:hypothetical protein
VRRIGTSTAEAGRILNARRRNEQDPETEANDLPGLATVMELKRKTIRAPMK